VPPAGSRTRMLLCWRCDELVDQGRRSCPRCRASLEPDEPDPLSGPLDPQNPTLGFVPLIVFFSIMLVISLVYGLNQFTQMRSGNTDIFSTREQMRQMAAVEVVDTILVVVAILVVARPKPIPVWPSGPRPVAWLLSIPVLVILLGINLAYHWFFRQLSLHGEAPEVEPLFEKITPLLVLLVCVQPAVVEELFFRYLALGTLRRQFGVHASVAISAVMFGFMHIFVPLSIPALIIVGMGLGYMRVASGSMVLPMLMHFAHNLAVIYLSQLGV
jgi:membrane protease YdiL (CAAX protease family)